MRLVAVSFYKERVERRRNIMNPNRDEPRKNGSPELKKKEVKTHPVEWMNDDENKEEG